MLDLSKITIGTDLELFLIDKDTKKFRSAIGLIGGQKGKPIDIGNCCGLEEDNVSVELTVPAVSLIDGIGEMWDNLQFVLKTIEQKIPDNLQIECCPSAVFEKDELKHPKAILFGCEPDFNAWRGGEINPKPVPIGGTRSCGGHIHIGYPDPDIDLSMKVVKFLDLYLGVPSVEIDTDVMRRSLYGKAGSFRIKPYGVEYRVLSNFWIKEREYLELVFGGIQAALTALNEDNINIDELGEEIQRIINSSDVIGAENFLQGIFGEVSKVA